MNFTPLEWWQDSCDLRWEETPSGSKLRQVTSVPAISTVIYHEQPFCSADGRRIAIFRSNDVRRWIPGELMVYDIETYRTASLLPGSGGQGYVATSAWSGVLFASAVTEGGNRQLWRIDLNSLGIEPLSPNIPALSTVCGSLRVGLSSDFIAEQQPDGRRMRGIFSHNLSSGEKSLVYESYDIGNPHLQFRLNTSSRILVQENRGWIYNQLGQYGPGSKSTVGLISIAADGTDRKVFPVGGEHTPRTTGHECWIGDSDHVLISLAEPYYDGERRGTVLELSHDWDKPRVIFDTPYVWNHVSASRCGRYFVADCYDLPGTPLIVGHIASGKTAHLCDSKTDGGGGQHSHAHPYLTSDNKWVVFNSTRTGLAQVYLASVPDGLLENLR